MTPEYQNTQLDFEYSKGLLCANDYYGVGNHLKIKVDIKMIELIFGDHNVRNFIRWLKHPQPKNDDRWSQIVDVHFRSQTTSEIRSKLYCVVGFVHSILRDQKHKTGSDYLRYNAVILLQRYHKQTNGRAKMLIGWILDHLHKFRFLSQVVNLDILNLYGDSPQIVTTGQKPVSHPVDQSFAGYWILIVLLLIAVIYIFIYRLPKKAKIRSK